MCDSLKKLLPLSSLFFSCFYDGLTQLFENTISYSVTHPVCLMHSHRNYDMHSRIHNDLPGSMMRYFLVYKYEPIHH